jgi:hypothetical protein
MVEGLLAFNFFFENDEARTPQRRLSKLYKRL